MDILRKRDGMNYEEPDKGCIYYMYPIGEIDTGSVSFAKKEYAECYVVTVPYEMQVLSKDLKLGLDEAKDKVLVK